jgi:hypothetical protein
MTARNKPATLGGEEAFVVWFDTKMSAYVETDMSARAMIDDLVSTVQLQHLDQVARSGLDRKVWGWLRNRGYVPDRASAETDEQAPQRRAVQLTLDGIAEWVIAHRAQVAAAAITRQIEEWCKANDRTPEDVEERVAELEAAS